MSLVLITPPATEPVTLTEAKAQARVEHTALDDLITIFIKSSREAAEHLTGRAFITQTLDLKLDAFPVAEIELPKPKVISITSVSYIDTAEATQTVSSANYSLDSGNSPGWVLPAQDYSWPSTADVANAVTVRFTAGYGAAGDVPSSIKQWMLMQIAAAVRNAEAFSAGINVHELPNRYVDGLLDPHRTFL